jgi:type II secretory ATPase GspE/PulE/Tfp pilus assembly ATPase PilB-like protein
MDAQEDPLIVEYVQNLVLEAIRKGASEIVVRQSVTGIELKYRVGDESLFVPAPPQKAQPLVMPCLKKLAGFTSEYGSITQKGIMSLALGENTLALPVTLLRRDGTETLIIELPPDQVQRIIEGTW